LKGLIFMPISEQLLERIKSNDPTLLELNLAQEVDSSLGRLTEQDRVNLITSLYSNTTVQRINLDGNEFHMDEILRAQKDNKNLRVLKLRNNLISRSDTSLLFELLKNTNIQWIDCGTGTHSHFIIPRFEKLQDMIPAGRFVVLDTQPYATCQVFILDSILPELINDTTITHVELSGKFALSLGSELALVLERNQTIKALGLSHCYISDAVLGAMVQALKKNHTLLRLDLGNNMFSDESAELLVELFSTNKTIEAINLSGNGNIQNISNLIKVLEMSTSIKEISISNTNLNSPSILAISNFLENNKSCEKLDLCAVRLDSMSKELFNALQKNTSLTSINLDSCLQSPESLPALAECISNNKILKKINLSNEEYDDEGFKLFIQALSKNKTIEEINLSRSCLSLDMLKSLRDAIKLNASLINLNLEGLSGQCQRFWNVNETKAIIAEINALLVRNQTAPKVSEKVQLAEEKLKQEVPEGSNRKILATYQEQAVAIYRDAFDTLEKVKEQGYPNSDSLSKIIQRSLINSYLFSGNLAAAWELFREINTWDDSKIYHDLASSFFYSAFTPNRFEDNGFIEWYQFILLLLAKAGNSQEVTILTQKAFHSLKSGRDPKGFDLPSIRELTGRDVIISLNTLRDATCLTKDYLAQQLAENSNHSESSSYQQHYDLLDKIIRNNILDNEIISNLTQNSFVRDQLKIKDTDQIAILEQMILQPENYPPSPLKNLPHAQDIFNLSKILELEKKLYEKLDISFQTENEQISVAVEGVNVTSIIEQIDAHISRLNSLWNFFKNSAKTEIVELNCLKGALLDQNNLGKEVKEVISNWALERFKNANTGNMVHTSNVIISQHHNGFLAGARSEDNSMQTFINKLISDFGDLMLAGDSELLEQPRLSSSTEKNNNLR
jgi:Ran GTPase-activating protein (RanGAP) involved in mRNA processing and transport